MTTKTIRVVFLMCQKVHVGQIGDLISFWVTYNNELNGSPPVNVVLIIPSDVQILS